MSNPTTPFGWQMPTNTDLVTDLPADFEVFGQAVATSMADLLGGTTGQLLSKTSNTDMDFTWTTPNPGDITGVTAGTGISGGGTSGDVTVTNSMATAMTTSGDLIQATGSGTFARLATGTSGQYLTTNGTTNSWASVASGGMTLISETVASANSAINFTGISGSYKQLLLVWCGIYHSTTATQFALRLNGDTGSNYANSGIGFNDASAADLVSTDSYIQALGDRPPFGDGVTSTLLERTSHGQILIDNYASTTKLKSYTAQWNSTKTGTGTRTVYLLGTYNSTSAITSVDIFRQTGAATMSNIADTSIRLYGIS